MSKKQAQEKTQTNSQVQTNAQAFTQNEPVNPTPDAQNQFTQNRRRPHHGPMRGPVEKPKDFWGTLKKLVKFMSRYKAMLILVFLFAIASTLFVIVGPRVLSQATTDMFEGIVAKVQGTGGIDYNAIAHTLQITLVLYVASAMCSFGQFWIMSSVSQRTCYEMRKQIDQKINRMPMGYFESHSTGDVLSRITNDVDTLGQSLNQGVTQLITSLVTIVGVLVMMFSISWVLALITFIVLPVSAALLSVVVKHSQGYFKQQQDQLGAIDGQVEQTFAGHTEVKAFCQEDRVINEFSQTNDKLFESAWKSQFISGLMMPIMNLISNLAYIVVAVVGSLLAVRGQMTVGDIQAFIQYVRYFTQPIQQLTQVANVLQMMAAAAERVFEFLDQPEVKELPAKASAKNIQGNVKFDHVSFGYTKGTTIIHDFSAEAKEGQTVAIVGPTGAGKTTLVKLLMRFYDVDSGAIYLDGADIRDYKRSDLRSAIAMVLQDTWLFHGTIRENIRYGNLNATDEEVEEAAKEAHAHHFISAQPDGYDCVVDENADNISQGERQLITIARAILANRQMLILDEATSSVDTRTEQLIQNAMDALMKGRTSFVIAHRLSTIKNADLILCIDHGDIVEQGTHEELLKRGGFYAKLYNSQFVHAQ